MTTENEKVMNTYEMLSALNVNEHVEQKGKYNYLSWTWAVDQFRRKCPTATWEYIRHNGMPYLETPYGFFIECSVTCDGVTLSELYPVLDNFNKPIAKPNAFQLNTSMKRALVKAIANFGLGIYIYAGEDLPTGEEVTEDTPRIAPEGTKVNPPIDQQEKRRIHILGQIQELSEKLGHTGADMIIDFEEKAKCKMHEMRVDWLESAWKLMKNAEVEEKVSKTKGKGKAKSEGA